MEGKRIRGRRSVNRSQREAERAYPEEIDNKGGRGRGRNEKEKGGGKRKNDAKRHRRQRCRKKPGSSDVFREKFSEGDGYVDQSFLLTHGRPIALFCVPTHSKHRRRAHDSVFADSPCPQIAILPSHAARASVLHMHFPFEASVMDYTIT